MGIARPGDATEGPDYDVAVVGGGPAGCTAGVFCARYGLDTVIFDHGRSSIKRCGYLENYLGFPAGIDVETFYELAHDHAHEAGCRVVSEMIETVTRSEAGDGFAVETGEGRRLTARRVVAATRYDGEYLRALDDEEAMFESYEYDGEEYERFDRTYAETDGTTPIEGLYVASPTGTRPTPSRRFAGGEARPSVSSPAGARSSAATSPHRACCTRSSRRAS